jgi:hypothetical protein
MYLGRWNEGGLGGLGACVKKNNAYEVLEGNPERKIALVRSRLSRDNNIKIVLK